METDAIVAAIERIVTALELIENPTSYFDDSDQFAAILAKLRKDFPKVEGANE